GIAARVTRQYSRMGALLDPIIDRALVIAGVVVCWKFELLPRWMLDVMVAREAFMLLAGQYALRHGVTLKINWFGRWAVWPVMSALMMGLVALKTAGTVALAIGLVLAVLATVQYGRDAITELRRR
ncbi:MAG TPA: CDP-alcohol phosphatidyltransferase family protein, partial [Nitrolancea sp.]|nr:CDP-alcohol phosphatidyltransferase family protein [Nitrolancea sp.]